MATPLSTDIPDAPNPDATNALMSGAPPMPRPPMAPPQGGGAQQQPAPDHDQTVSYLRHADAIRKELETIIADPALGKSSVKSQVISGVTRLVASRFMKPDQAVDVLSKVPTEPLLQLKWAKGMLAQIKDAERGILLHHAVGFAGQGAMPTPSSDDHLDVMAGLSGQYNQK